MNDYSEPPRDDLVTVDQALAAEQTNFRISGADLADAMDEPMAGRDFDADGQPWDERGARRMDVAAALHDNAVAAVFGGGRSDGRKPVTQAQALREQVVELIHKRLAFAETAPDGDLCLNAHRVSLIVTRTLAEAGLLRTPPSTPQRYRIAANRLYVWDDSPEIEFGQIWIPICPGCHNGPLDDCQIVCGEASCGAQAGA